MTLLLHLNRQGEESACRRDQALDLEQRAVGEHSCYGRRAKPGQQPRCKSDRVEQRPVHTHRCTICILLEKASVIRAGRLAICKPVPRLPVPFSAGVQFVECVGLLVTRLVAEPPRLGSSWLLSLTDSSVISTSSADTSCRVSRCFPRSSVFFETPSWVRECNCSFLPLFVSVWSCLSAIYEAGDDGFCFDLPACPRPDFGRLVLPGGTPSPTHLREPNEIACRGHCMSTRGECREVRTSQMVAVAYLCCIWNK